MGREDINSSGRRIEIIVKETSKCAETPITFYYSNPKQNVRRFLFSAIKHKWIKPEELLWWLFIYDENHNNNGGYENEKASNGNND